MKKSKRTYDVIHFALLGIGCFTLGRMFPILTHQTVFMNRSVGNNVPIPDSVNMEREEIHGLESDVIESRQSKQGRTNEQFCGADANIPLGLNWVRQSYENPWKFSINRRSDLQIHSTISRILSENRKLPRVVVSFTSLPRRFRQNARRCIELLKDQEYLPDHIYISIPKTSRRSKDPFIVPSWIEKDPIITVLRPENDYGPSTKLIPALEAEAKMGNMNTRVITMDDDEEGGFDPEKVLKLFAFSLIFDDAAIGLTGWNVTCMVKDARCNKIDSGIPARSRATMYNFIKASDDYACHTLFDWKESFYPNCMGAVRKNFIAYADVIEGYKGALYQPRFYNLSELKSIVDKERTPDNFFRGSDMWLSGWLSIHNIKRIIVNPGFVSNSTTVNLLKKYSLSRNLSSEILEKSEEDIAREKMTVEVEKGIHDFHDFHSGNKFGATWFEEQGAWVQDLWKKPDGFKYASEI